MAQGSTKRVRVAKKGALAVKKRNSKRCAGPQTITRHEKRKKAKDTSTRLYLQLQQQIALNTQQKISRCLKYDGPKPRILKDATVREKATTVQRVSALRSGSLGLKQTRSKEVKAEVDRKIEELKDSFVLTDSEDDGSSYSEQEAN